MVKHGHLPSIDFIGIKIKSKLFISFSISFIVESSGQQVYQPQIFCQNKIDLNAIYPVDHMVENSRSLSQPLGVKEYPHQVQNLPPFLLKFQKKHV